MVLADAVVLWIAVLLAIGFVGFFVVLLGLAVRVVKALLRLAAWPFRGLCGCARSSSAPDALPRAVPRRSGPARCPVPRCGHVNPPAARYCARCGRPLSGEPDVDDYG